MNLLRYILAAGCVIAWQCLVGQVVFDNPLRNDAFLARAASSNGAVHHLKGEVQAATYNELRVAVYKNDSLQRVDRVKLLKNKFWIPLFLEAGKWKYKIECTFTGTSTYQKNFDNIIVGDVFLIQGQSNAVASDYRPWPRTSLDSVYQSPFLRSFGTSNTSPTYSVADTSWHLMTTDRVYSAGSVGQWGMVLASQLLDSFGIPICILNGAVGGTPVSYHIPDSKNHMNPQSNYGRLLTRVTKAGIEHIRGIFYFQGESDGSYAVKHDTMFRSIVNAWKQDYQGYEELYVIQVREGCGSPSLQLREVQRQFGLTIDRCQTLSANGLDGHDGCHYNFDNGYKRLGHQISQIVGRDLYNSNRNDVDPPDIKNAVYSNSAGTEIQLHMQRADDTVFVDSAFHQLFGVQGDANVRIISGELRNNRIYLKLNQPSCKALSLYYNGAMRTQSWVRNSTGMGLLTFYGVPIMRYLPITPLLACKGQTIELGNDAVSGLSYQWTVKGSGQSYNTSKIQVKIQSDDVFELKLNGTNGACTWSDTIQAYVYADSITLPTFDSLYKRCRDDTIALSPISNNYESMSWNGDAGFSFCTTDTGWFVWNGFSSEGCIYQDSFEVLNSVFDLGLPDSIKVCADSSVLLQVDSSYINVSWNQVTKAHQYQTVKGNVLVSATNIDGCTDSSKVVVTNYPKMPIPDWNFYTCTDQKTFIARPEYIQTWYHFNTPLDDTIVLSSDTVLNISLTDRNSCPYRHKIELQTYPNPELDLPLDSGYCQGSTLTIPFDSTYTLYINGTPKTINPIEIDEPGIYNVMLTNIHECSAEKTIHIEEWPNPDLSLLRDTVICHDSLLVLDLSNYSIIRVNDSIWHETRLHLEADQHYAIEVVNQYKCASRREFTVEGKECNPLFIHPIANVDLLPFPNPISRNGFLHFNCAKHHIESVDVYTILGDWVATFELRSSSMSLNLENSGIYILQLKLQNGQTAIRRIFVY